MTHNDKKIASLKDGKLIIKDGKPRIYINEKLETNNHKDVTPINLDKFSLKEERSDVRI